MFVALSILGSALLPFAATAEATETKLNYALVSGKVIDGTAVSQRIEGDDWNSIHYASLRILRHLGGSKMSNRTVRISYVSHASVIPGKSMIFLLQGKPTQSRYVSLRPYHGEKFKGRLCLLEDQMEDVSEVGIKISDGISLCPNGSDG